MIKVERPVYSLWFAVRRDNRPEAAEAIIDKYGLDTLVFSPLIDVEMGMLPYSESGVLRATPTDAARLAAAV